MEEIYLGIDVQLRRKPAWMALDSNLNTIDSGWIPGEDFEGICQSSLSIVKELRKRGNAVVITGVDAPRRPLSGPREYYWNGKQKEWRKRKHTEVGNGRHCEVIIKAASIANPQWTPIEGHSPEWTQLGFALFTALEGNGITTHEVFPSASYALLEGEKHLPVSIDFSAFRPGVKDMIDACMAAFTVAEFSNGRGCEVGSDGLGTIVLPRPLPDSVSSELLRWPASL